jgi:hypothetical protein
MTTDRFERRLPEILREISLPQVPDYTDDILDQTARIRQRPGWTLPERWLPMDFTAAPARIGRVPWRAVGVLALLILALAVAIAVVGSRTRPVNPFYGHAANGSIIYDEDGEIYVTDALGAPGRVLIGGQGAFGQRFSHDGSTIWFARVVPGGYAIMQADADGSDVRQATSALLPDTESSAVSPDETELAAILIANQPELGLLSLTDEAGIRTLDLGGIVPTRFVAWRPPTGDQLVFLGHPGGIKTDLGLYVVDRDGTDLKRLAFREGESIDTENPNRISFQGLAFSDDGTTVAYSNWEPGSVPGKDCSMHLLDLTTGSDRTMSYDPSARCEAEPVFLGDGRILLERQENAAGTVASLLVAPADASSPGMRIGPDFSKAEIRGWDLSPDRSKVVVVRNDGAVEMISIATGLVEPVDVRITVGDWSWQRLPSP